MKVRFDVFGNAKEEYGFKEKMVGYFELNEENIKKAEELCDKYLDYVLSIGWDYKNNEIVVCESMVN